MSLPRFCHRLDRICGIEYCATWSSIPVLYKPGPRSFYVRELLDEQAMRLGDSGEYAVLLLVKRGIDTFTAVRRLARLLRVPPGNIYYLGLKDRAATTIQHVFVKKTLLRRSGGLYRGPGFTARVIGYIPSKPSKKHLIGNRFTLIVARAAGYRRRVEEIIEEINGRVPSYYGYQRFGVSRPNTHILGKHVVLADHIGFYEEMVNTPYPGEPGPVYRARITGRPLESQIYERRYYSRVSRGSIPPIHVLGPVARLYVEAYAAYLYNRLLSMLIGATGTEALPPRLPMPGCPSAHEKYRDIAAAEGAPEAPGIIGGYVGCWERETVIRIHDPVVRTVGDNLIVEFSLGPGMYASIIMRELFKKHLVLS